MNISTAHLIGIQETFNECRQDYTHVVHAFIWAPWDSIAVHYCPTRAAVMMQLRFDGTFGFVGGIVDSQPTKSQDIVDALHRECKEELNLNLKKFNFTTSDHLCTFKTDEPKLFAHFYSLRVTVEDILEMEKNATLAEDYMDEVLGYVRVPLFTMGDGRRGFPMFLNNMFIGNAKEQLLYALKKCEILTEAEIDEALAVAVKIKAG